MEKDGRWVVIWGMKAEDQQPRMRRVCQGWLGCGPTEAIVLAISGMMAEALFVN